MKKKGEEDKSLQKYHFAMAGIRTHKICLLSCALYSLGNGALLQLQYLHLCSLCLVLPILVQKFSCSTTPAFLHLPTTKREVIYLQLKFSVL